MTPLALLIFVAIGILAPRVTAVRQNPSVGPCGTYINIFYNVRPLRVTQGRCLRFVEPAATAFVTEGCKCDFYKESICSDRKPIAEIIGPLNLKLTENAGAYKCLFTSFASGIARNTTTNPVLLTPLPPTTRVADSPASYRTL